jgi:predicted Zn-dependent peptidase
VLDRANIALGGSFTSRLNQDLREKHGWSYGAGSHVQPQRGIGRVSASAAVITEKTAEALKAMLADLDDFSHFGLKPEEVDKTRSVGRQELVQGYQTVDHASFRLANDAGLGLGPDYEAKASLARDAAEAKDLAKVASVFYDRGQGTVVIVGSRAAIEKPLADAGVTGIVYLDAEGNPVKTAAAKPAEKKEPKK